MSARFQKVFQVSWVEGIENCVKSIEQSRKDLWLAVIAKGNLRLSDEYKKLEVKEYDWCKMTNKQRKLHLLKLDLCANEIKADQGFNLNEDGINNGVDNVVVVLDEDDDLEMLDAAELNNSEAIHFKSSSLNNKLESKPGRSGLTMSKHTLDAAAISSNEAVHVKSVSFDSELESKSGPCGLTKLNNIGDFENSGLPSYLESSWNNAQKIKKLEAVGTLPGYPNKCTVISLTQPIRHIVIFSANFRSFKCDCPKYAEHAICAHTIAAAYSVEKL